MKLTLAQHGLLCAIVRKGSEACIKSYPPAKKLVELGLATYRSGSFGHGRVEPTEAGRAAITAGKLGT